MIEVEYLRDLLPMSILQLQITYIRFTMSLADSHEAACGCICSQSKAVFPNLGGRVHPEDNKKSSHSEYYIVYL